MPVIAYVEYVEDGSMSMGNVWLVCALDACLRRGEEPRMSRAWLTIGRGKVVQPDIFLPQSLA